MSRGFVKEGDQEEIPLLTPRANLPFGISNYVTANGLNELNEEREALIAERKSLMKQSKELNRIQINHITTKLSMLEERINSARIINLSNQTQDEVQFGAIVTIFKLKENCTSQYQIVGVDEANITKQKVSFLSPIAKILLRKKVGDIVSLQTPAGERQMEIKAIAYK